MRFGVCASFQEVATLETVPFDFLEENVQQFLIPERPQADFEALLREARRLPVPIETAYAFLPGDLNLIATPQQQVDTVRLERYVKTALQRAEQVGIRVIGFGSAVARSCPEGYDHDDALQQIQEHLATWNAWAGEYGIQIPMEPMAYEVTNMVNTIAEGGTLISRIATTGARLLADTYHMGRNHEDPETLLPVGPLLGHVHVAELQGRAAPGQHGEDFRPYFSVLHRAGYDQRIVIECHWHNIAAEVDTALAVLREQWADVRDERHLK